MSEYNTIRAMLKSKGYSEDICHDASVVVVLKGARNPFALATIVAKRMEIKSKRKLHGIPWENMDMLPAKPQQSEAYGGRVLESIGKLNESYQGILNRAIEDGGFKNLTNAQKALAFRARKALLSQLK